MSKSIDTSRGYDKLSLRDKIHLAQRGRLPSAYIDDDVRTALDVSGRPSNLAYGANTGTIAVMTTEELEREVERRKALEKAPDDPRELMPGLDNEHSERLEAIENNQAETAKTQGKRTAAAERSQEGPAVPVLGHPANRNLVDFSSTDDDEDEESDEEDDEDFEPTREEGEDAYTGQDWPNDVLRSELKGRGLVTSGNKAELRARLVRDDQDELEEDDTASSEE